MARPLSTTRVLVPTALTLTVALGVATTVALAPPALAETTTWRIASSTALTDSAGNRWEAPNGFTGGRSWSTSPSRPIAGTKDDALYRSEFVAMSAFGKDLPNGSYDVTLKNAEIYHSKVGLRVFSVKAEGKTVVQDLDIARTAGVNTAYDRTFRVEVKDGRLDLDFSARTDLPKIAGIQITSVDGSGARAVPTPTATPTAKASPSAKPTPTPKPTKTTPTPSATSSAPPPPPPARPGGRPGAGNTGVPAGTKLTPHYGDLTITKAGARYDSLDIHGFVKIEAPNVTITRSLIRGGKAGRANVGLVTNYNAKATGLVLTDSTLRPDYPSVALDGVKGANFTVRGVDISGVVDNVKVHGDNVRVERSWLHNSRSWSSDPYQGGRPSHNDAVQILGGRNISVVDSTLQQANNAGVQVTQDYRAASDVRITGNYIDGGGCSVNLNHKPLGSMKSVTVSNNRFGTGQRHRGCGIIATKATKLTATGNVWDATGQPVRISSGG